MSAVKHFVFIGLLGVYDVAVVVEFSQPFAHFVVNLKWLKFDERRPLSPVSRRFHVHCLLSTDHSGVCGEQLQLKQLKM